MRKAHAAFQHGSGDGFGRFEGAGPQGAAFPVGREKGLSGHFWRRIAGIMDKNKATLIGMGAIVLWSTLIGLVRSVSEALGPVGGAAMIYTASAVLMVATSGFPKVGSFPRRYLVAGSSLFVLYEVFLSLSVGYADNGRQAIEVAMLNYLWPSLTVLFAILFNGQKASLLIVPGLLLSLFGVCWVLGGDNGFHPDEMLLNIQDNPLSYGLAFSASILWATYCTITVKMSRGHTGVTFFLLLTALALWLKFLLGENPPMRFDWKVAGYVCMAALAVGYGYAAWNKGIVHGNTAMLAAASYFTPVISSAIAAVILDIPLTVSFWQGAVMVCIGSLMCWVSTRKR